MSILFNKDRPSNLLSLTEEIFSKWEKISFLWKILLHGISHFTHKGSCKSKFTRILSLPEDAPFDIPLTGSFCCWCCCCCFGRNSRAASNLPPDIFKARMDASCNKTIFFNVNVVFHILMTIWTGDRITSDFCQSMNTHKVNEVS